MATTHARLLLAFITSSSVAAVSSTAMAEETNFVVGHFQMDDSCSTAGQVCSRVTCTVINAGKTAAKVNVELTIHKNAESRSHGTDLVFAPGARKTVSHDFTGFLATHGECVVLH